MFLGKCLLKENQPEKAKKFILLAAKGAHSDVALFHLIQANIKSGEKSEALENISQLLQQPKHVFYLARIRNLLRENFNSKDERKILFHFLSSAPLTLSGAKYTILALFAMPVHFDVLKLLGTTDFIAELVSPA